MGQNVTVSLLAAPLTIGCTWLDQRLVTIQTMWFGFVTFTELQFYFSRPVALCNVTASVCVKQLVFHSLTLQISCLKTIQVTGVICSLSDFRDFLHPEMCILMVESIFAFTIDAGNYMNRLNMVQTAFEDHHDRVN